MEIINNETLYFCLCLKRKFPHLDTNFISKLLIKILKKEGISISISKCNNDLNNNYDWKKEIYFRGVLHSLNDEPSIEYNSNNSASYRKEWYKNGLLHRDGDLPAIEWANPIGIPAGIQEAGIETSCIHSYCYYINGKIYFPQLFPNIFHDFSQTYINKLNKSKS